MPTHWLLANYSFLLDQRPHLLKSGLNLPAYLPGNTAKTVGTPPLSPALLPSSLVAWPVALRLRLGAGPAKGTGSPAPVSGQWYGAGWAQGRAGGPREGSQRPSYGSLSEWPTAPAPGSSLSSGRGARDMSRILRGIDRRKGFQGREAEAERANQAWSLQPRPERTVVGDEGRTGPSPGATG